MSYRVIVNTEKCIGCGECVEICPAGVYELQDGLSVVVDPTDCLGCEYCLDACEADAITVTGIDGLWFGF